MPPTRHKQICTQDYLVIVNITPHNVVLLLLIMYGFNYGMVKGLSFSYDQVPEILLYSFISRHIEIFQTNLSAKKD